MYDVVKKFTFVVSSRDELVVKERERRYRPMSSSVRLSSVCLSSVTFVRLTQPVEIFGNVSSSTTILEFNPYRGVPLGRYP